MNKENKPTKGGFICSYAATSIKPTQAEIDYIFNNLENLTSDNACYSIPHDNQGD